MRFVYNAKSLPPAPPHGWLFLDRAAARMCAKITALNPDHLALSAHGRDAITIFQQKAEDTIKKYVHILAWSLYPELPGGHDVFVDYGGGHGLLACLAKDAGIRRVVYNDIYAGCCADARLLAKHLDSSADAYVCGDISAVRETFSAAPARSCALASINVIEHVYDMDSFIEVASSLVEGPMTMVLSTSANPLNPFVARRHYRQHRLWEFTDGPHEASYPMDTTRAFCAVRRDIIKAAVPEVNDTEADALVAATRGMWKPDIEKCAHAYRITRRMPPVPTHPTNTCDPLTGSWQERLLDIQVVSRTLAKAGFVTKVRGAYYSGYSASATVGMAKRGAALLLNYAISLLGSAGARLAPCFMFHATRR